MAAPDRFATLSTGLDNAITRSITITPGAGSLAFLPRGVFVDVGGTIAVTYPTGETDTLTLAPGVWHPMRPDKITGGSATGFHIGD